ncbi:MAG: RidA family protein [Kiloniellales bacterium]
MLTTKGGQEEMLKKHNPGGMAPAFSRYSLGVEAPPEVRWLFVSGQVGVGPNGALAEGPEAQMETAWRNVFTILGSAGMGPGDLVRVNAYLTREEDVGLYREVRDRLLGGAEPASTLLVISALAHPEWRVEIEAVAAAD